jgi:hypothetical protein
MSDSEDVGGGSSELGPRLIHSMRNFELNVYIMKARQKREISLASSSQNEVKSGLVRLVVMEERLFVCTGWAAPALQRLGYIR